MRRSIARQFCDAAGDYRQDYRRDQRLERDPADAERGLFVNHFDISLDQNRKQIAITPKFAKIQCRPPLCRANAKDWG